MTKRFMSLLTNKVSSVDWDDDDAAAAAAAGAIGVAGWRGAWLLIVTEQEEAEEEEETWFCNFRWDSPVTGSTLAAVSVALVVVFLHRFFLLLFALMMRGSDDDNWVTPAQLPGEEEEEEEEWEATASDAAKDNELHGGESQKTPDETVDCVNDDEWQVNEKPSKLLLCDSDVERLSEVDDENDDGDEGDEETIKSDIWLSSEIERDNETDDCNLRLLVLLLYRLELCDLLPLVQSNARDTLPFATFVVEQADPDEEEQLDDRPSELPGTLDMLITLLRGEFITWSLRVSGSPPLEKVPFCLAWVNEEDRILELLLLIPQTFSPLDLRFLPDRGWVIHRLW